MRQRYFDVPFALSGDQTAIPDPLQVGGTVSFTEGWNFNYQRDLNTDPAALPIDRSTMNWLFYQVTLAIAALQQSGVPEWITAAQNGGVAYSYGKGSVVLYSAAGTPPFVKYVSLIDANTVTPGTDATKWQVVADAIATSAQASAGTDNTTIMTPLRVAGQTALRALLAGSITQVFNVAPGSGTQAPQYQQMTGRLLKTSIYQIIGGVQQVQTIVNGVVTAFTATGATTFAPTAATTFVEIEGCGGGGAGGGAGGATATTVSVGSPGCAGSYGKGQFTVATIGASITVTVGAGGAGANNTAGTDGGTSSVGSVFVTPGGKGGGLFNAQTPPVVNGNGTPSGAVTGGNITSSRYVCAVPTTAFSTTAGFGGPGCPGAFGSGSGGPAINTAGTAALNIGSGGCGTVVNQGGGSGAGSAGAPGTIIIREYA